MDCSLPVSSVHGIFQARVLEWGAIAFSELVKFIETEGFPDSSAGKESACNARDPDLTSGSGRSAGEGIDYPSQYSLVAQLPIPGFPGGSVGKESACNVGDLGSIPGLGRPPGGGHGNSSYFSCLENVHGRRSLAG